MPERLDDQYRKAALAVAGAVGEGRYRSLFFSSATRRQGTTSAILQIALELKNACGLNPLVVEFNRASPELVGMFGLDPARSVATVVAGTIKASDCVQPGPGGLALLPVGNLGQLNSNGQKLGAVARKVLEELQPAYDVILWDAPPLLEQSDAFALSRVVPRMVLVVEAGKLRYEVLERISSELANAHIELLGSLLVKQKRLIPGWLYRLLVR